MPTSTLQEKLHQVRVTRAHHHFAGSVDIDEDLLLRVGARELQHTGIYIIENGERFATYTLKSSGGRTEIWLESGAVRKTLIGDHQIIDASATCDKAELPTCRLLSLSLTKLIRRADALC